MASIGGAGTFDGIILSAIVAAYLDLCSSGRLANGVRILEEMPPNANGRPVCFLKAPDGAKVEIIEKM